MRLIFLFSLLVFFRSAKEVVKAASGSSNATTADGIPVALKFTPFAAKLPADGLKAWQTATTSQIQQAGQALNATVTQIRLSNLHQLLVNSSQGNPGFTRRHLQQAAENLSLEIYFSLAANILSESSTPPSITQIFKRAFFATDQDRSNYLLTLESSQTNGTYFANTRFVSSLLVSANNATGNNTGNNNTDNTNGNTGATTNSGYNGPLSLTAFIAIAGGLALAGVITLIIGCRLKHRKT